MTASGSVRTATKRRLVDLFATLDGFESDLAEVDDDAWWVTAFPGGQAKARRVVMVGIPSDDESPVEPLSLAAAPRRQESDGWRLNCAVVVTATDDADVNFGEWDELQFTLEQDAEDAYNAVADLLAQDDRITPEGSDDLGVRGVRVSAVDGPASTWPDTGPPSAVLFFTISAAADITRNQPNP
jgi:hypothetical protein